MGHRGFTIAWALLTIAGCACAGGARAATEEDAGGGDSIVQQLQSHDQASIEAGTAAVRTRISGGQVPFAFWHDWVPALLSAGRLEQVIALTAMASTTKPDQKLLDHLMEERASALLALDRPEEALEAAKAQYNVCEVGRLGAAWDNVVRCLERCHPGEAGIGRRFRNEQARAMVDGDVGELAGAAARGVAMLAGVTIEEKPWEASLARWKIRAEGGGFKHGVQYGNLLLVAGKGEEAEGVFRGLYKKAGTAEELDQAAEGIARSLRAEDGDMYRADVWMGLASRAEEATVGGGR